MSRRFDITHQTIRSEKLQKSLTVVQISDLHNACFGEKQADLASAVSAMNPDLIVCTGDLFNRKRPSAHAHVFELIEAILPTAPILMVEGNHEIVLGETGEAFLSQLQKTGVQLLRDEAILFQSVRIIGLRQRAEAEVLRSLTRDGPFNLVLCHRPELFPEYADCGADLILCGHAHGGQIRFGSFSVYAPQQGLFPKYTSGLYTLNSTNLFVSRGLGNTIPFPRIFNRPELCVLHLVPKE